MENPQPYVSAHNWVILDRKKGEVLFGKCETECRQVASLTKIMTSYVVLNLIEDLSANQGSPYSNLNCRVKIIKPVSQMEGTSACLLEDDSLSVHDLLYGMMLPSGNDAAQALAIYFGQLLLNHGKIDPNKEMLLCPQAVSRKMRELTIQMAFDHRRTKLLKVRADAKAERRLMRLLNEPEMSVEQYRLNTYFYDETNKAKVRDSQSLSPRNFKQSLSPLMIPKNEEFDK